MGILDGAQRLRNLYADAMNATVTVWRADGDDYRQITTDGTTPVELAAFVQRIGAEVGASDAAGGIGVREETWVVKVPDGALAAGIGARPDGRIAAFQVATSERLPWLVGIWLEIADPGATVDETAVADRIICHRRVREAPARG